MKQTYKKVYMLSGSGDGMLGVYSSAKRALKEATAYVMQGGEGKLDESFTASYKYLMKHGVGGVTCTNSYGSATGEVLMVYMDLPSVF